MDRAPKTLRLAALALALPLALTACGDDATDTAAGTPTAAPTTAPTAAPTEAPAAPSAAATTAASDGKQVTLTVAGGKVTGDTGRVPVALGSKVHLSVTADVADEVHVHGFDLHEDTEPGTPAVIDFTADRPGVFEIELEESRVLLTRLQVQ